MHTANEVIMAIIEATTPGLKAKARRFMNRYVQQQKERGHRVVRTKAALKAVITRYHGSKHYGMFDA